MAFTAAVVREIVSVAKASKIEPAALLAVVEVESSGQPFEADGVTPRFLYERHVMYRELKKRRGQAKAEAAIRAGLARTSWNRSVQYFDQKTSDKRLKLMAKAKAFDEECACRSASWGLGQTMGFHAETQGFKNAVDFVAWMTRGGVTAQVEAMVKEIKKSGLVDEINRHDWAGFAYRYNGAGYKQNQYDTRMAQAYARWRIKLPKLNLDVPAPEKPAPIPPPPDVEPTEPAEEPATKPAVKSKTVWASVIGVASSILAVVTDWRVLMALAAIVFVFIIADRVFKLDIKGWFR